MSGACVSGKNHGLFSPVLHGLSILSSGPRGAHAAGWAVEAPGAAALKHRQALTSPISLTKDVQSAMWEQRQRQTQRWAAAPKKITVPRQVEASFISAPSFVSDLYVRWQIWNQSPRAMNQGLATHSHWQQSALTLSRASAATCSSCQKPGKKRPDDRCAYFIQRRRLRKAEAASAFWFDVILGGHASFHPKSLSLFISNPFFIRFISYS